MSGEKQLEPINDTLNPELSKFGMPWYVILGILSLSVLVFMLPGLQDLRHAALPERARLRLVAY